MKWLFLVLGNIWMLPTSLVSALYVGVMWAFGQFEWGYTTGWALVLLVPKGSRLFNHMSKSGWAGWSSGPFILLREDHETSAISITHEERHVKQQLLFGVFQPILYIFSSVWIWLFKKQLHSYYDNPFEVDARRAAGQKVKIPPEQWKNGDRWAWW